MMTDIFDSLMSAFLLIAVGGITALLIFVIVYVIKDSLKKSYDNYDENDCDDEEDDE